MTLSERRGPRRRPAPSRSSSTAFAQDVAKVVTKAEVEKVTGAKFKDGWKPMPTQIAFAQEGGDLQVSVDVEPREAASTVRSWEAMMKKMQPSQKVDTVPGVGKDAIFVSTRPDSGALTADFDKPLVQLQRRGRRGEERRAGEADRRRPGQDRRSARRQVTAAAPERAAGRFAVPRRLRPRARISALLRDSGPHGITAAPGSCLPCPRSSSSAPSAAR